MSRKLASILIISGAIVTGSFLVAQTIFGANVTSSVTVGNATPVVSGVSVNGGTSITLTANATTSINVNATISDNNGCSDLTAGTTTVLLYRNGVTSSTCLGAPNNLNCYVASVFTASSTCTGTSTSIVATTTFGLYYFAQATDASSSFSGQGWRATVIFKDPSNATGSTDSATTTLNSLTAINVSTSSINYGLLSPNTTSTISTTTIVDVGNSSTTINLNASPTLNSGSNVIATSSQHYATSSFTYGGSEQQLAGTPTAVSGFTLIAPTTTTNVTGNIFWALQVPNATPTGTYSGTNVFTAVFSN